MKSFTVCRFCLFAFNIDCYIAKAKFVEDQGGWTFIYWGFATSCSIFLFICPTYFCGIIHKWIKWIKCNVQSINICVSVFPCMVIMLMKLGNDLCSFLYAYKVEVCLQIVLVVFLLPFSCSTYLFQCSFLLLKNCLLMELLNYAWLYGLFLSLTSLWITCWWVVR